MLVDLDQAEVAGSLPSLCLKQNYQLIFHNHMLKSNYNTGNF